MTLAMHASPVSLILASVMIHNFGSVIDTGNVCITSVVDAGVAPSEPLTVCQGLYSIGTKTIKNQVVSKYFFPMVSIPYSKESFYYCKYQPWLRGRQ
jgi:hypothetical protein